MLVCIDEIFEETRESVGKRSCCLFYNYFPMFFTTYFTLIVEEIIKDFGNKVELLTLEIKDNGGKYFKQEYNLNQISNINAFSK